MIKIDRDDDDNYFILSLNYFYHQGMWSAQTLFGFNRMHEWTLSKWFRMPHQPFTIYFELNEWQWSIKQKFMETKETQTKIRNWLSFEEGKQTNVSWCIVQTKTKFSDETHFMGFTSNPNGPTGLIGKHVYCVSIENMSTQIVHAIKWIGMNFIFSKKESNRKSYSTFV